MPIYDVQVSLSNYIIIVKRNQLDLIGRVLRHFPSETKYHSLELKNILFFSVIGFLKTNLRTPRCKLRNASVPYRKKVSPEMEVIRCCFLWFVSASTRESVRVS